MERPYELAWTPDGVAARVRLRGSLVLTSPMLNRGTAFTPAEREALGLTGLLPEGVSAIETELARVTGSSRLPQDRAHIGDDMADDLDPAETQEWLDSLDAVLEFAGGGPLTRPEDSPARLAAPRGPRASL